MDNNINIYFFLIQWITMDSNITITRDKKLYIYSIQLNIDKQVRIILDIKQLEITMEQDGLLMIVICLN
jgi:hypothetical protein